MVLDWGLNPGPPALEASTIPLGYRGGGEVQLKTVLLVSWRHGKNNRNDANIKKDGDEHSGCKMVDGVDVNVFVSMESGPHNM